MHIQNYIMGTYLSVFKRLQKKSNVEVLLSSLPGARKSVSLKVPRFHPLFIVTKSVKTKTSIEHCGNEVDNKNLKIWEKELSQCHFVHQKSHTDFPTKESGLRNLKTKIRLNYVYILLSSKVIGEILPYTTYRVSQEERTKLREGVPYVKIYRYNPKHLYPKLNGYGDNGQRSLKL